MKMPQQILSESDCKPSQIYFSITNITQQFNAYDISFRMSSKFDSNKINATNKFIQF